MPREIEVKARIDNPDEIRQKLAHFAVYNNNFEKQDRFWRGEEQHPGNSAYGVRVRQETKTIKDGKICRAVYVTWKRKKVRGGVEFNEEKEFEVSDAPLFEEFLIGLGFKQAASKRKRGSSWRRNAMTVELTDVEGLGWFVELEILLPDENGQPEANESAARDTLLAALETLKIPKAAIEGRSYTQLLSELS